jgi:hypothetical protein
MKNTFTREEVVEILKYTSTFIVNLPGWEIEKDILSQFINKFKNGHDEEYYPLNKVFGT